VQSQTAQPSVPLQAMPRCWDARSEIEAMRAQLRSVSESLAMVVTRVGGIESSLGALREQVFAALAEQTTRSEAHAQALVQHIAALGNAVASAGARAEEAVRSVAQRQTAGDELGDVRELVRSVENRTRQSSETLNKISQLVSSFSESLQREHNEGDCGRRSQQQQQMPRPQPLPGGRSLSQARHRARGRPRSSPPARDSRGARAATNLHLERDNDASDGDVDLVAVVDGGDARVSSCESGSEGDLLGSGFSEWRDADQRAKGAPARCLGVWRELAASEATLRSVSSEELRAFLDSVGQSTAGRQATLIRRVREFFGLQSV
jgi:TolA-binding protein